MGFNLWLWSLLTGSRLKAMLVEGDRLLSAGRNVEALEIFRNVVKNWPTRPEGYLGLSRTYQAMGLRPEAMREATIAECLEILKHNPDDGEARFELAKALYDKEMYGWAATHIDHALRIGPRKKELLLWAARIFRANRNFNKAAQVLRQALRRDPMDGDLYEQLAYCLKAAHRAGEALKAASIAKALKAVEAHPGDPNVLDQAIRQFLASGRKNMAMTLVEKALQRSPNQAGLHRLQGELLLSERRLDDAAQALRRAVQLDPADLRAHRLLAKTYQALGDMDKAQEHLKVALTMEKARKGGDPVATEMATIRLLLDSGRTDQAQRRCLALLKHYPDDWRAFYCQGQIHEHQEKYDKALKMYEKARQLAPKAPLPHMAVARIKSALGDTVEAVGEARRAVSLAPRDPEIRRELARILRNHGFMDQAIEEEEIADSLEGKPS